MCSRAIALNTARARDGTVFPFAHTRATLIQIMCAMSIHLHAALIFRVEVGGNKEEACRPQLPPLLPSSPLYIPMCILLKMPEQSWSYFFFMYSNSRNRVIHCVNASWCGCTATCAWLSAGPRTGGSGIGMGGLQQQAKPRQ